jgi:hypothetical protein|nr:MAG TPA: DNA N-6-adenine-methyltransferase [Caudoviricetes sp.]
MKNDYGGSHTPKEIKDLWQTPKPVFRGMDREFEFVAVVSGALISGGVYRVLPGDFDSKRWPANIASAIGDALIFPTLSFMAFMPEISAIQFISKMAAVTVITIIMRRYFTFEGGK